MSIMENVQEQLHQLHVDEGRDSDYEMDFSDDDELNLMDACLAHVFLLKKPCPQFSSNSEKIENVLLQMFTTSINNALTECSDPKLESIKLMFEKWNLLQPTSKNWSHFASKFPQQVATLQPGNTLPIYVKNQNCMLLLTKHLASKRETISLSTFRCSLPNKVAMSNGLEDPIISIPETMETILNIDILKSQAFSKQLHDLATGRTDVSGFGEIYHFTRHNDVPDPILVTDWIVGLLVPQEVSSNGPSSLKIPQIQKKFRDQISFNENDGYSDHYLFRRSGMYMALKGSLQLKISECFNDSNDQTRLIYKIIMLQIVTDFANHCVIRNATGVDLGAQLLAKLGRRFKKLDNISDEILLQLSSKWISNLKTKCLNNVSTTIDQLTSKMKSVWDTQFNISSENHLMLSNQDLEENLYHRLLQLDKFIKKLKTSFSSSSSASKNKAFGGPKISEVYSRYTTAPSIINASRNFKSIPAIHVWLHDTEYFIKFEFAFENIKLPEMSQLLKAYITTAKPHYKNDPLGQSQINLVTLRGLQVLDKIATQTYPLLFNYKPDVNLSLFDNLLLPFKKDMTLLDNLVVYFKSRDEISRLPGILSSSLIKPDTFSVIYAQQNEEMKNLREKILIDMETAIEEKYEEISSTVEQCKKLQDQNEMLSCNCTYETKPVPISGGIWNTKKVKKPCKKCELPTLIKSTRKSVKRYERPLPLDETFQWAVIFELMMPKNFEIFRNYLAYTKYELWGDKVFNGETNISAQIWLNYKNISSYKFSTTKKIGKGILLASSSKPLSSTSHSSLDVFNNVRETYININNGMGCTYFYNGVVETSKLSIIQDCSFQLSTTKNSIPYLESNLQANLEKTDHFQNSVLARQNECHQNLSLEEFLAFGSLRAGNRIQLRNLYQIIVQGTLSLEQEPVLALLLQTLWQIGPINETNNERESHSDFIKNSNYFAEEFLDMMDNLVKNKKGNYSNSMILFNAVVITRRIEELHIHLQGKCYAVLKKWRKKMSTWITEIEAAIDRIEMSTNSDDVMSLQRNLKEVVLCSMFSYNISGSEYLPSVIKDEEDVNHWLQSLYLLNKLDNENIDTSQFFNGLWNYGKNIALRMQLENPLDYNKYQIEEGLKIFIAKMWDKATKCTFKSMDFPYQDKNKGSLVTVEYLELDQETQVERITHQITFDFIQGLFKVNRYSSSVIPQEVKSHKLFQMYFKDGKNLRVQQYSDKLTKTLAAFHGRQYEFHQVCFEKKKMKNNKSIVNHVLVIQEIEEENRKLVLLDPEIFSDVLSKYFSENYTHWLDINNNVVHFRPITKPTDHKIDYTLQRITSKKQERWKLLNTYSGEYVLSIHSPWFKQITQNLECLELENFINLTFNNDRETITAYLRRYNLRFTLNLKEEEIVLKSVEYSGFNVSANRKQIGTLVGLKHGLLLEKSEEQIILMPHSTIKWNQKGSHQESSILLSDNLRQPQCFVYKVDNVLQQLKACNSKSAWLYLAALHAVTSSPFFPDPFTELTGTEMAVQILQSACVWSCSPYDEESLQTLKFIRSFSPKREWNEYFKRNEDNGSIELIKWPQDLPSILAYDGYAIIIDKLIEDSEKLAMLHNHHLKNERDHSSNKSSEHLRLRGYLRNVSVYGLAANLEYPKYFTDAQIALINNQGDGKYQQLQLRVSTNILNLQCTSFALFSKSMKSFQDSGFWKRDNLNEFLIADNSLNKATSPVSLKYSNDFSDLLHLDFQFSWLKLYNMATSCESREDIHLFGIALCAVAYNGAPIQQIANLLCIFLHGNNQFPKVPSNSTNYWCPVSNNYDSSVIIDILEQSAKPFTSIPHPVEPVKPSPHSFYTNCYSSSLNGNEYQNKYDQYEEQMKKYENDLKEYNTQHEIYKRQIKLACEKLNVRMKSRWPCEFISIESIFDQFDFQNIDLPYAIQRVNGQLKIWHDNYKLKLFVEGVQNKLNKIWDDLEATAGRNISFGPFTLQPKATAVLRKFRKLSNSSANLQQYFDLRKPQNLTFVEQVFKTGCIKENSIDQLTFYPQRNIYQSLVENIRKILLQMLNSNISAKILYKTGLAPRLAPLCILKFLAPHNQTNEKSNVLFLYAGALAVFWTHLKRINRCVIDNNEDDNPGHENWSPKDHPEWLLLELELDIMIRPIQVKVAKQMIEMPNGPNGVTQLNMGEGKTSVIVPMLCATLAQTDNQLCRITVLSSMFKMNLNSLTFATGRLLNKRVYYVPCQRDMQMDEECVDKIQRLFEECLEMEGVLLTLPEYRLSFRLLAYDKMYKKEWILGQKILNVENFLRKYSRDVLDESDELLSVKYQLVYTVGEQVPIDGGDMRWKTCQKILDIIPEIASKIIKKFGGGVMEIEENVRELFPHQFSICRLLGDETCLKELHEQVAESILTELIITDQEKIIVKKFLVDEQLEMKEHKNILERFFCDENPDVLNQILLLSGYLRRGVLGLALTKRWRVEYGVNPNSNFKRLMAIPFRAKDVAAEKTEFGHPDLAIILTHLCYYYSGLSGKQLEEVFRVLKSVPISPSIYSLWISKIPQEYIPDSLKEYSSLNLKDAHQKEKLFDVLRKHKMVIDFWLSHCVFPRESKQFPGKLVMTAWDLCYERQRLPVTGFSGTNDSQVLLPLMVTQQDIKELECTNDNMTKTLLQPENGMNHKGFPMGVTCQQILDAMRQDNLTVLIDAGALMLECSNEQVANLWLETDPNIEAAVYFNANNELLVKTRGNQEKGQEIPFDVSPYQGRLGKCGVFLDDQHTRGTDLKFPVGSMACVTVATRMKRDKLIQACMRMRKLGQGHSVTFYLSHEARDKIKGAEISTQGVLDWVCENTRESNQDGLLYWALAGRNYAQRLAAEDHFHFPSYQLPYETTCEKGLVLERRLAVLADQCVDDEVVKLVDMYGQYTQLEFLTELVQNWFNFTKRKLREKAGEQRISAYVLRKLDKTREKIADKCLELVPDKMILSSKVGSMMEEEQEKELELELEVETEDERNIERPAAAEPAIHNLRENVKTLVAYGGEIREDGECFVKICQVFENTTFWNEVQPECWQGNVFATKDFCSTIKTNFQTDAYLRPVQFLISNKISSSKVQWLAISPYEANELLPYFRTYGNTKCTLHMFSARRSEKQDLLINNHRLQLPSTYFRNKVLAPSSELMSLLLASGNLYFASMEEQKTFAKYLGIFPQPWSEEEKLAFEQDKITKSGFWLPQFRSISSPDQQAGFQEDPTGLVKKILLCRHSSVSEITHLMQILNEKKFVDF